MVEVWVKNIVLNGKIWINADEIDLWTLYESGFWEKYFDNASYDPEIFPGMYLWKYYHDPITGKRRKASVALFRNKSINIAGIYDPEFGRQLAELTESMVNAFLQYVDKARKELRKEVEELCGSISDMEQ